MNTKLSVIDAGARLSAATVRRLDAAEAALGSFLLAPVRRQPPLVRVFLPANGNDDGSAMSARPGCAEIHVYDVTGACAFIAGDGAACAERHGAGGPR